jgi:hypothetical protein
MGTSGLRIQNIKLMKRGAAPTVGKASAPILAVSMELSSLALIRRNCRDLLNRKSEAFYHNPFTREHMLADLRLLLNEKIYPKELWAQDKIMISLEPGRVGRYAEWNTLSFRCWEKNNRDTTLVEGVARSTRGYYDGSKRGYEFTYEFEKLNPVSAEDKAKLKNQKKIPKTVDPAKQLTPTETQQLQTMEKNIATGTVDLKTTYRVNGYYWYAENLLSSYLLQNVFTDRNSLYNVKVKQLVSEPDGSARLSFYRVHDKKNSYREVVLKIEDDATGPLNHYHIVKIEKKSPKP